MIADVSSLSASPFVLMSTHDPLLALSGDRRLVILSDQYLPGCHTAISFDTCVMDAKVVVLNINTGDQAMARTTSVTIGSQLDEFVGKLVESGRYGSTSEVVRTALRLLEQQENQATALKQAIDAGERSGESDLSLRDIAAKVKQKHHV